MSKELGVSKEEITMALESKNPVSSIYETTSKNDEDGISIIEKQIKMKNGKNISEIHKKG